MYPQKYPPVHERSRTLPGKVPPGAGRLFANEMLLVYRRCLLTMLDRSSILSPMNVLSAERRATVVKVLVEGNSIRATCRITGTAKGTVLKLVAELGEACERFHDEYVRGLKSRRIQCDEIWSFCYAKRANVPVGIEGKAGDLWTWVPLPSRVAG